MRVFRYIGMAAASVLVFVGSTAVPAQALSPYDPGAQSSLNSLVTAMESYEVFDGNGSYTGVTATALSDWGFARSSSVNVAITIEGDGGSWRAIGQDIHSGTSEYTYSSSYAVNGAGTGSVQKSSPQPVLAPTTATLTIADVGDAIDIDNLGLALMAGGVTASQVCDFTAFVPGTNFAHTSTTDQTDACEVASAASGATMRSVLARILATGLAGDAVIAAIALEFVGDGCQPAAPPTWTAQPNPAAPTPRTPPAAVPDGIWRITQKARKLAALNQVDETTANVVTEQCLKLVAIAFTGADPYSTCSSEPIFLSGQSDVPEATNHDIEALAQNPAWIGLNRKLGPNDGTWKNSDPICQAKLTGQHCDEYPFLSSQQGGGAATPRPSLKAIDGTQNSLQGTRLGQFYSVCAVQDGDAFLVVPVPPFAPTVPTLAMCNK